MTRVPTSLVFEPNVGAHQAEYLLWIVRAWRDGSPQNRRLVISAPAELVRRRPEIQDVADASGTVLDLALSGAPRGGLLSNLLAAGRWAPLRDAVRRCGADRVLLQSLDSFLSPLAARQRLPPLERLGGILFRPTLHYASIGSPPDATAERLRRAAKASITRQAVRHPALTDVFSLDPTAVPALQRSSRGRIHALLDPAPPEPPSEDAAAVRARYGVEPGRALVTMAGTLDSRKGVDLLLRALAVLPEATAERAAVVLAGHVAVDDRAAFERDLRAAQAGRLQVVLHDAYLSPEDLAALVAAADLLVLPYDRHVGSSGFMVRAAAAGTPLLSQTFGYMGHAVRTHRLGWTADPSAPHAFARALADALTTERSPADRATAETFASAHSVGAFAAPLLDFLAS